MSSPDGHIAGPDPLLGQVFFDRYRVLRKVEARRGAGLYAAQHALLDRPVALEVVEAGGASPAAIDDFLEASRTVARVGHENVVEIFNGGRSPAGAVFLALEALEGGTLAELVGREGALLWDRAQGIVQQIAAALGAVHRHGIAHGDLRPENVVLPPRASRRDFVKLLDFGVARVSGASDPRYAAPEAGAPDARADVYALGALAYHMVTGRPPFVVDGADATAEDLAMKHASETPAPPSALRPAGTLPADLDGVILRALEKDPEKRWPDMAAFADAVGRCRLTRRQSVRVEALAIAELSGKVDAFEADARKRRRVWSVASVATAVAIAIGVLYVLKTAPGHVRISTVPTDADLTFNGLPVKARSPVVLDAAPGRYMLVVSRTGYRTAERTVDVAASQTVSVPIELAVMPAPPPAPEAAAPSAAAPAP